MAVDLPHARRAVYFLFFTARCSVTVPRGLRLASALFTNFPVTELRVIVFSPPIFRIGYGPSGGLALIGGLGVRVFFCVNAAASSLRY